MHPELLTFAARLRALISVCPALSPAVPETGALPGGAHPKPTVPASTPLSLPAPTEASFDELALELFTLQFHGNPAYQTLCLARGRTPGTVQEWTQIPAVPTAAFKELELSSIPATGRTTVFHSSGTTEQRPSRHFHHATSLAVYEASLTRWFAHYLGTGDTLRFLTPGRTAAPHSSLIHMFETLRQQRALPASVFLGNLATDGSWALDFPAVQAELASSVHTGRPVTLLGTAFSFVHLLDLLAEHQLKFRLPTGSRVMETGGYKNRSRTMPKAQLHALITAQLGVPAGGIVCEYGMSELSSQAYGVASDEGRLASGDNAAPNPSLPPHHSSLVTGPSPLALHFPPWARAQVISPETCREVPEGGTGIIRVLDLANVFSVAAVQTEDLGIRRGTGFELLGRAEKAEPRGCSLMTI